MHTYPFTFCDNCNKAIYDDGWIGIEGYTGSRVQLCATCLLRCAKHAEQDYGGAWVDRPVRDRVDADYGRRERAQRRVH